MERPRAPFCLAVGAIAAAIAVVAGGAFEAPRDLGVDLSPVAARVVAPQADATTPPAEDGHLDPPPKPSKAPPPAASSVPSATPGHHDGMAAGTSDDPHGTVDSAHDDDLASHEPMAMDGHVAEPSSSTDPGDVHAHGAGTSTMPEASGDHGVTPGTHDGEMVSQEPVTGHDDASGGHEDAASGHGDAEPAGGRPRGVVFGGFVAINAIALAGAAILRRRDGAAAALKAQRTPVTSTKKDAPR